MQDNIWSLMSYTVYAGHHSVTLPEIIAMMGRQSDTQKKMFCYNANLDDRMPHDHVLRKIRAHIDFDFIYNEVGCPQFAYNANLIY